MHKKERGLERERKGANRARRAAAELTDDFLPPFCPFVQVGTDTQKEKKKEIIREKEKGNVRLLTPIKTRHFSLLQLSWRGSS